jgi:hypothetical protein
MKLRWQVTPTFGLKTPLTVSCPASVGDEASFYLLLPLILVVASRSLIAFGLLTVASLLGVGAALCLERKKLPTYRGWPSYSTISDSLFDAIAHPWATTAGDAFSICHRGRISMHNPAQNRPFHPIVSNRMMAAIGKTSFSIYLIRVSCTLFCIS